MSISAKLQSLQDSPRIIINDAFMGDPGASELARFLNNHQRVVSLEIKSNDISPEGFILVFKALQSNPTIKQINIEHNNLGANDYVQWHDSLSTLINYSPKLERLNLSNNKISSQGFSRLISSIVQSKSLKLLQIRYNNIGAEQIQNFANQLKRQSNETLLYIQLTGNKAKKQSLTTLQSILSKNRKKNPTTKQKLMGNVSYGNYPSQEDRSQALNRYNKVDQIAHDHMIVYLEDILNQNRIQAAENKIRLQNQLSELQRRQKIDAAQLNQIERKCGQVVILNRNLQFELDRTLAEYQQIHRDEQSHLRVHEEKVRQASRQIQDLQSKYQEMESRMNKQHEIKMKEIVRDWEARLRNVQQKIRSTENQNLVLQSEVKKYLDKRQKLRLQCVDEQNSVRMRVEGQEAAKYNLKMRQLESKLRQIEDTRDGYVKRNQELIFELQKSQTQNKKQIAQLQEQLQELKLKQSQFNAKNKDFFSKNEKIRSEIQMKQITIDKLEEQIGRLDTEIENKRLAQSQQFHKLKQDFEMKKINKGDDRKNRLQKLSDVENTLRNAQLENAKLRQEYALLAQKLQVGLSLAVHSVFQQNSLL